jgi:hypothetical protein
MADWDESPEPEERDFSATTLKTERGLSNV